jgi:hypothetical protein
MSHLVFDDVRPVIEFLAGIEQPKAGFLFELCGLVALGAIAVARSEKKVFVILGNVVLLRVVEVIDFHALLAPRTFPMLTGVRAATIEVAHELFEDPPVFSPRYFSLWRWAAENSGRRGTWHRP